MKKMMTIMLALLLAISAVAMAENAATGTDVTTATDVQQNRPVFAEGFVLEVSEEGVLLQTADGQQILVKLTEENAGLAMFMLPGDFVSVAYDGKMTFSLPAQITAQGIIFNKHTGVVEEVNEEGFLMQSEDFGGSVFVTGDAAVQEGLVAGMPVTVFSDGKMTRSVPPQIFAQHVRMLEVTGVIDETTEEGFLMTTDDGVQYRVAMAEDAVMLLQPAAGKEVRVVYNGVATMSLPALINGLELLPAEAEATITD